MTSSSGFVRIGRFHLPPPKGPRVRRYLGWLLLAVASHALAVWALPHVVMRGAMSRLVPAAPVADDDRVRAVYPPLATADARAIVLPSPDLAYALCVYDLSRGAVDVDAQPMWPAYWSVALYADNTDNYLVRNDVAAASRPVHWRLALAKDAPAIAAQAASSAEPASERELVLAPSARGLVLLRVLVTDRTKQAATVVQAQRALRCQPAP